MKRAISLRASRCQGPCFTKLLSEILARPRMRRMQMKSSLSTRFYGADVEHLHAASPRRCTPTAQEVLEHHLAQSTPGREAKIVQTRFLTERQRSRCRADLIFGELVAGNVDYAARAKSAKRSLRP
jgi:hypothetical protein